MKHYGLNGAHPQQGMNGLLDGVIDSIPGGNIANNLLKGLSFNTIKTCLPVVGRLHVLTGSLNTKDFEASMGKHSPCLSFLTVNQPYLELRHTAFKIGIGTFCL